MACAGSLRVQPPSPVRPSPVVPSESHGVPGLHPWPEPAHTAQSHGSIFMHQLVLSAQ